MKLYFWPELKTLKDYGPGFAFAHTDTKEEAIRMIMENLTNDKEEFYGELDDDDLRALRAIRKELEDTAPKIPDGPFIHVRRGCS